MSSHRGTMAAYVNVLNTPISLEFSNDARTAMIVVLSSSASEKALFMVSANVVLEVRVRVDWLQGCE